MNSGKPLIPVNPEGLDSIADALLREEIPQPPPPRTGNVSLEDRTDHWSVDNVVYRNGIYRVDLAKTLLENGAAKTQQDWSAYTQQAKAKNSFHVADFPLYHALFTTLYKQREHPQQKALVEEARAFLKKMWTEKWLMTLTRIIYKRSGFDTMIHNFGQADQWQVQTDIVGPNEWVKNATNKNSYKVLLDTDNTAEIQAAYHWLTGLDAYLWRVNSRPTANDERVAGFYADGDSAGLDCCRYPQNSDAALGVRLSAAGAQKI